MSCGFSFHLDTIRLRFISEFENPWMRWDCYHTAKEVLERASDDFGVKDCFAILQKVSQEGCPIVVSMIFDVTEMRVYWNENRQWDRIQEKLFDFL